MPNADVMTKWVTALESGEYVQARNTLRRVKADSSDNDRSEGLCCLGVLCELAVKDGIIPPGRDRSGFSYSDEIVTRYGPEYGHVSDAFLPDAVMEWAGLLENNPRVSYAEEDFDGEVRTREWTLADLNDDKRLTFKEIADQIRSNFIAVPNAGKQA